MNILKKSAAVLSAVLLCFTVLAQDPTGGVKGTIINRADRAPIQGATLKLKSGATEIGTVTTDAQGNFQINALADGMYDLSIEAPGFLPTTVNVTVNDGYVKNLFSMSLSPSVLANEVDDSSFGEFDLDGTGYEDTPTILYDQNDVFNNVAGYNFSSVRFKARGYASESQDVYVAGVKMNDALTGYSPYSLWSGLNEATRSKSNVIGSEISPYGIGGYNGLTNIYATPAQVRPGMRFSLLTNSALYRTRVMGTYASPENGPMRSALPPALVETTGYRVCTTAPSLTTPESRRTGTTVTVLPLSPSELLVPVEPRMLPRRKSMTWSATTCTTPTGATRTARCATPATG